jgi:hypothetical protein
MSTSIFWGEIAPCEHLLQIYDEDDVLFDSLEGFIRGGIEAEEGIILIATPQHVRGIEQRMWARGVDIAVAQARGRYITRDAEATLARFMRRGMPDERLFRQTVEDLLARVVGWESAGAGPVRRIRAFGEMVAILWSQGHTEATVQLEQLWHRFCQEKGLALFCAYPKLGLDHNAESALAEVVAAHSKVVGHP